MNRDIYQAITARFIAQLKRGTVPWQKPCLSVQNIVSRKPYRGINSLLLGSAEFQSPFWLTFKQSLDLGGHVKKGEKSTPVIYYKILEKRDDAGKIVLREDGRPARIPFLRWANVFNLDQTEGIQAPAITPSESVTQPHEKAAAIVENARLCPIHHAGFAAYYSPEDDIIRIPAPSIFRSQEDYYHTLYHEMIHASGHISRLNREGVTQHTRFGSERYSKEELIGELGAAFLSNDADILDSVRFENSAAYLASWTRKLESDPRLIVSAASQAQRASDFIRGIEYNEALQECQISPEGMPLTWAQEHGIDTRIPGFGNRDQDGDGGFNLARMEARHQADRPAFQAAGAISVAMKSQRVTRSSKTSTTYEGGNDFRAQDDVAKPPRSRISRRDFQPESSARQQHDDGQKRVRPLRQFADYASKETLGQVHAGGFLHHVILINEDGRRTAPSQLTNDERKRRISEAWFEHIRKFPTSSQNPVIQHRLVFSMSRELHDKLVEAGINPDRVLQSATKKVMGKFNERFHPADSIGYAYGIHHDTDNLHVHVALCPRTARGAPIFPSFLQKLQSLAQESLVVAVYGSTEAEPIAHVACSEITSSDWQAMREGKGLLAGTPVLQIRLRIIPDQWGGEAVVQAPVPKGQADEILVTGDHVLKGYLDGQGEAQTKVSIEGEIWHRTGDAGCLDESGRPWLLKAKRLLAVESDQSLSEDTLRDLKALLSWAAVDEVRVLRRIPVDKRHNAKIDYPRLMRLLQ